MRFVQIARLDVLQDIDGKEKHLKVVRDMLIVDNKYKTVANGA